MSKLLSFPDKSSSYLKTPASLLERGFCLRRARDSDIPRLHELYADSRAEEMAPVPWPIDAKQSFLAQQFSVQHTHYLTHYLDADFLVITHSNTVHGRFYLFNTRAESHIIDICLMAQQRGSGIGRLLIEQAQREAHSASLDMMLHVLKFNPRALALYQRLGFTVSGGTDTHHRMIWHHIQNVPNP